MKIFIQAKPRANKEYVKKIDDSHFVVAVKEPPIEGRANEAVEKALALYFNVPCSKVQITSGYASRQKVVEVG